MWCYCVQLGCERQFNIKLYGTDSHFCHSAYITWFRVELWSAHVPARLSNFRCRTHFMRRDVRVERTSDVYQLFPEMEETLIEKVCQRTFLYDTKSPDYRDQHMRANAWEGIGKGLKIKRKFYMSSHDVRIVCPRLNILMIQRERERELELWPEYRWHLVRVGKGIQVGRCLLGRQVGETVCSFFPLPSYSDVVI